MLRTVKCTVILCLIIYSVAYAGEVHMKNGNVIRADRVWEEGDHVYYQKWGATIGLEKNEVERIITELQTDQGDDNSKVTSTGTSPQVNKNSSKFRNSNIKTRAQCKEKCKEDLKSSAQDDSAWREFYICYYGYCEENYGGLSRHTQNKIANYKKKFKTRSGCLIECDRKNDHWMNRGCPKDIQVHTNNFEPTCPQIAIRKKNECLFYCDRVFGP